MTGTTQSGDGATHTRHIHTHFLFQLHIRTLSQLYGGDTLTDTTHRALSNGVLGVQVDNGVALAAGDGAVIHIHVHALCLRNNPNTTASIGSFSIVGWRERLIPTKKGMGAVT